MKYKITLNNKTYEVVVEKGEAIIESEYDAMAPAAKSDAASSQQTAAPVAADTAAKPAASHATGSGEVIKAPLPGTVSGIKVAVGDTVKKGQPLIIIEAMKMENDISAPKDGKITGVYVLKGQSVERGTELVSVE